MAITFLDLIVVLLWPLVLTVAVWVIAINALAERDEISKVVEALTRTNGVEQDAKRGAVSLHSRNLSKITNRHRVWIRVHFRSAAHSNPTYQGRKAKR